MDTTEQKETVNKTEVSTFKRDPPIEKQNYVCLSFISPEGISNCKVRAIKVRGVFDTIEEANKKAMELSEYEPEYDIYVGEVGKWLPYNPDPYEHAQEQKYQEEGLQELMDAYKEMLEKSNKLQKEFKEKSINDATVLKHEKEDVDDLELSEEQKQKMLEIIKNKNKKTDEINKFKEELKEKENLMKLEKERLFNEAQGKESLVIPDDKMEQIKKMYEELRK